MSSENGEDSAGEALRVTVINGDLTFVRQPLILGHYRSLKLTGTEHVMDGLVGGAMSDGLKLALYPDAPGTNRVFMNTSRNPYNPRQMPRPEAVIVVGLGDEGKLSASNLADTVRQGVLAWAQRNTERDAAPARSEIAATLIGSGGTGISAGQAAQLIAQGVAEARQRIAEFNETRHGARPWPSVSALHLIELYLDRATDAWRALRLHAEATPGRYTVTDAVQAGTGALRRPLDAGYRGAEYDLISALTQQTATGESSIAYTLDTKRARSEVRAQVLQQHLVRSIVTRAAGGATTFGSFGRALFNMLVPVEMRPFLSGRSAMLLELDEGTAAIPWELLDTGSGEDGDSEPWAIRARLLRKLRVANPPERLADADADASVLVIGEPACDPKYPPLPGARAEALAVAACLEGKLADGQVESLIGPDDPEQRGPDALTVITTLLGRGWRIVHIAAHGEGPLMVGPAPTKPDDPPQRCADPRGVVLSDHTYLGSHEIRTMPVVPELVFVNCCHLGRNSAGVLETPGDRARFASGVAAELIAIGVRCVIAAGWAVEDEAASTFATTFYEALLDGRRFIDAVAEARMAARRRGGITWAAYQCYGDPDWRFRTGTGDAQRPATAPQERYDGIGSAVGLQLALETIAVRSKFQGAARQEQGAALEHLEERFSQKWGDRGHIAESFAVAWSEVGNWAKASAWYEKAVMARDSSASIKAIEQLAHMSARMAWAKVEAARPHASDELTTTVQSVRREVEGAIGLLDKLSSFGASMERESLYGSTYKRLAMIESVAGDSEREGAALQKMRHHYGQATALGRESQPLDFSYPALNEIAADVVLGAGSLDWKGPADELVEATRKCLEAKAETDPDFWSVLGQTELRLYQALAHGDLASKRAEIVREYDDLRQRVSARRMWSSVYDTASFVLPRYESRAPASEKEAAAALLAHLYTLAEPATAP